MKRVKEASFEAIEANATFEKQATTDPRELMPYTRVSDPDAIKKREKITLISKVNQNNLE